MEDRLLRVCASGIFLIGHKQVDRGKGTSDSDRRYRVSFRRQRPSIILIVSKTIFFAS